MDEAGEGPCFLIDHTPTRERFSSEDLPGRRTVMVLWSPDCPHSKAIIGDLPRGSMWPRDSGESSETGPGSAAGGHRGFRAKRVT